MIWYAIINESNNPHRIPALIFTKKKKNANSRHSLNEQWLFRAIFQGMSASMKNAHLFSFLFGSLISLGLWLACADSRVMAWRGGTGGGIDKILEELKGVNETIYSNLNQFSLLPYCEEAQVGQAAILNVQSFCID